MLTWSKVRRTLEELEWDVQKFLRTYESLGRPARGPRRPSPLEIKAVREFQDSGDYRALMRALGTKNGTTANNALRRVIQHEANA